jgi:hypothetical protein
MNDDNMKYRLVLLKTTMTSFQPYSKHKATVIVEKKGSHNEVNDYKCELCHFCTFLSDTFISSLRFKNGVVEEDKDIRYIESRKISEEKNIIEVFMMRAKQLRFIL